MNYATPTPPTGFGWLLQRFKRHMSELIRLSAPIVVSRAGILLMVMCDVIMVGRYSSLELAYMTIGTALIVPILITSVGLIMGTLVISANSYGAGDFKQCGAAFRRSLPFSFGLGVIAIFLGYFGENILSLVGQSSDLSINGGKIMLIAAIGIPGHMIFVVCSFFLEGIKRPLPGMIAMIIANLINILMNWWLIYGIGDIPEMGAAGATWATTIARWSLGLILLGYVWFMKDGKKFGVHDKPEGGWASWSAQRKIGYATGISIGAESCAFSTLNMFAGKLGVLELAAFSIGLNLLALPFMMAMGIGGATAVRVGIAYGRKDFSDLALAGWSGIFLNVALLGGISIIYALFPEVFIGFYTKDPALASLVVVLLIIVAMALAMDGGQVVMANALRGRHDVWIPSIIQIFSYLGVLIPSSFLYVFYMDLGVAGLMYGVLTASFASMGLLCIRFHYLYLQDQKRLSV